MKMTSVKNEKSHVAAFGHDAETGRCTIRYRRGAAYHYDGVPAELFQKLVEENEREGGSVGTFVHAHIKQGDFKFVRAEDEEGATS